MPRKSCLTDGEPVGGGVEDLWRGLHHELKQVAGEQTPPLPVMVAQAEQVDVPGGGKDHRQQVADGHAQEDSVGGTGHSGPAENKDDERVGDEGDEYEDGHDDAVDGLDQLQRAQPVAGVQVVAGPLLVTATEYTGSGLESRTFYLLIRKRLCIGSGS